MRLGRGRAAASAVACAVVCVVALTGCGGAGEEPGPTTSPVATRPDGTEGPTPELTPEPTETVAPETVEPERPAAMDDVSVEGAEAAARYFLELYPYVYATGDLEEWKALSHPECVFCASVVENVEALHASGGYEARSPIEWEVIQGRQIAGERFGVEGIVVEGPSKGYDSEGQLVSEQASSRTYSVVFALVSDGEWTVLELDIREQAGDGSG